MENLEWGIYILYTVLINITVMNLLIAILSNTYDNVMASLDATHFKAKLNILNEIQDLMIWNRRKNELSYLHFIYYAHEDLSPSMSNDQFEGRVRIMLDQIKSVKDSCKAIKLKEEENSQMIRQQAESQKRKLEDLKGHLEHFINEQFQ